ncbi:MAG: hypothetical protein ACOVMQ_03770 [Cyclobacteriaceae bacterium]|jgi:hypothetical protein
MKKLLIVFLAACVASASFAQGGKRRNALKAANHQQIDVSQVPESVKSSFKASAADVKWEKHEAKGKAGKSLVRYVAVYTQDGVRVRARFKEDGTAMSSSKYMGGQKLPANIQTAATSKFPGAMLVGGEELTTKGGQVIYRVRLRNGGSKITTVLDANGNQITRDKMSEEHKEGEEEEGDGN